MDGGTMGERPSGCLVRLFAGPIRVLARAGLRAINDHGGVVASRLGPLGRAAGFYLNAWERWLISDKSPAGGRVPFPSPPLALGALADESLLSLARVVRRPLVPEEYNRIGAEVSQATDLYRQRGWLQQPASFFAAPAPAEPKIHRTHLLGGLSFERFEFDIARRMPGCCGTAPPDPGSWASTVLEWVIPVPTCLRSRRRGSTTSWD